MDDREFSAADSKANHSRWQTIKAYVRRKHRHRINAIEMRALDARQEVVEYCRSEAVEIAREIKRVVPANAMLRDAADTSHELLKLIHRMEELRALHVVAFIETKQTDPDTTVPLKRTDPTEAQ